MRSYKRWSYFRLELEELLPVSEKYNMQIYEKLTEDIPGHYVSWICGNYGYYEDDTPLLKEYVALFGRSNKKGQAYYEI